MPQWRILGSQERLQRELELGRQGKEENKTATKSIHLLYTMLKNNYRDQTLLVEFFIGMKKKDLNISKY